MQGSRSFRVSSNPLACPELVPLPPLTRLVTTRQDLEEGTNRSIIHRVENPTRSGKLIIFCDSFAEGLLPFLGQHFNRVTLFRLYDGTGLPDSERAHVWKREIIEEQRPDVVIDEILESFLFIENPKTLLRFDAFD